MATNEKKFSQLFKKKINNDINIKKQNKYYIPAFEIEVSLDFLVLNTILLLYLIEIDSLNFKPVFGQYVLLNSRRFEYTKNILCCNKLLQKQI